MGMLIEGFNGLVELEGQYGTTIEGRELINGVMSDALDLVPWPFRIDLLNLDLDGPAVSAFIAAIRVKIRTFHGIPEILP